MYEYLVDKILPILTCLAFAVALADFIVHRGEGSWFTRFRPQGRRRTDNKLHKKQRVSAL
jgi:hypothetical protein